MRHRRRSTPWERAALLLLAIGAAVAVRNVPWFALAALVLLPVWIAPAARLPAWLTRWSWLLAAGVAAFGALWLLQGAIIAVTRTAAAQAPGYPAGALAAVRREVAAHAAWCAYGDDAFADWLLWELPELRGRVAADARFELLSARQLVSAMDLAGGRGRGWARAARGCRLLVLDPSGSKGGGAGLPQRAGRAGALRRSPRGGHRPRRGGYPPSWRLIVRSARQAPFSRTRPSVSVNGLPLDAAV